MDFGLRGLLWGLIEGFRANGSVQGCGGGGDREEGREVKKFDETLV